LKIEMDSTVAPAIAPAIATPASTPRRVDRIPMSLLGSIALLVLFLAAWEFYVRAFNVEKFILPPPSVVLVALLDSLQSPSFWKHTWITVYETLAGFMAAVIIGVGLGALLGKMPRLERTLNPFVVATQVVPKVALVPLFVVWFGFGPTSKIVIAAVLAFFPILTNTLLGIKSVSVGHREVMLSLNASRWQCFVRLELPSALPYMLAGMEMGVVLAIIGAVVGEYLGGNQGLGNLAVKEMNSFNTPALFAVIVHLSIIGYVFYALVGLCKRFAIPWHQSIRNAG
jgi:NitT/TauT family transport system permease protein